jgi:hypothetical protein
MWGISSAFSQDGNVGCPIKGMTKMGNMEGEVEVM